MDMVERVARAIKRAELSGADRARAAIEAMRQPTPAMYRAGEIAADRGSGANYIWQAMIDTALSA